MPVTYTRFDKENKFYQGDRLEINVTGLEYPVFMDPHDTFVVSKNGKILWCHVYDEQTESYYKKCFRKKQHKDTIIYNYFKGIECLLFADCWHLICNSDGSPTKLYATGEKGEIEGIKVKKGEMKIENTNHFSFYAQKGSTYTDKETNKKYDIDTKKEIVYDINYISFQEKGTSQPITIYKNKRFFVSEKTKERIKGIINNYKEDIKSKLTIIEQNKKQIIEKIKDNVDDNIIYYSFFDKDKLQNKQDRYLKYANFLKHTDEDDDYESQNITDWHETNYLLTCIKNIYELKE